MIRVLRFVALVALFWALASSVAAPRLDDSRVSVIFAPLGLLAALFVLRPRDALAVAAAFLVALFGRAAVYGGDPVGVAPVLALDVAEAWLLAAIVRRFGDRGFGAHRLRDVGVWLGGTLVVAAAAATAAVGLVLVVRADLFGAVPPERLWLDWFMGDATGIVAVGSAVVLVGRLGARRAAATVARAPFEFALAGAALTVAVAYDFEAIPAFEARLLGLDAVGSPPHPSLLFLTFPAVVWLALRFPRLGPAVGVALTAFPAMHLVAAGYGPIWLDAAQDRTLVMQAYIGVAALAALCLSAAAWRVQRRERMLRAALRTARRRAAQQAAFIATMNHEVRTPLNGILGIAQILRADPAGARSARDAQLLKGLDDSARRLMALTDEFLDLSRLRAEPFRLDVARIAAAPVAAEALDLVAAAAARCDVVLRDDCPSGFVLHANPAALRHALVNLLANAVRHSRPGGVVTLRARAGDGWRVIEVEDCGDGFAAGVEAPGPRTTRGDQRAGLGLLLVESLMALHDGRMTIDSRPGEGARVRLHFPDRLAQREERAEACV